MSGFVAHVAGQDILGTLRLVRIHAPDLVRQLRPGHFVLARLYPTWDPYLRVPLFPARIGYTSWYTYVPPNFSFVLDLLSRMPAGTPIHVWGPYGVPFPPPTSGGHAVVITQDVYVPYVLGLIQEYARDGDVVLLVERTGDVLPAELGWLPPAVEYWMGAGYPEGLEERLASLVTWGDRFLFCGPSHWPRYFARWLEKYRFPLRPGTAFALIPDGVTCGLGVCDTCVLEVNSGHIRVCRKGPVLDLAEWFCSGGRGQ